MWPSLTCCVIAGGHTRYNHIENSSSGDCGVWQFTIYSIYRGPRIPQCGLRFVLCCMLNYSAVSLKNFPGKWLQTDVSALKMSSRVSVDLEKAEEEEVEEEDEESVNPTEVKMSQIVMPCHSNHRQELSVGQLLKWIDSSACLSAERHAGCPCVTASMDDIHFEHTISVGQVVNIKAKVNRAFNTSMEVGVQVSCEDLFLDRHWRVCHAYATFVTQRTNTGKKVILKPILPHTEKEQVEYSVAAERRRVRMLHDDIIKDLRSHGSVLQADNSAVGNAVAAEKTKVESVELVLPPHANHQVNTFGGQIMAWMVNVATIAASRLSRAHPTLRTIDMFTFRGPSQVGDRLLLRAIVNNAFKNSMEVGVRAEAYHEEGPNRHINSAFMIFEVLDDHRKLCTLPRIRPEPLEGGRRFQEAIARKKIRLDRKYIISCKQGEVPLSVPWDPRNQVYLSYNNVSALKMLAARNNWRLSSEKDKVRLYTMEQKSTLSFRVESEVDVPAHRAFDLLAELSNRPGWDTHYQKCELIHRVDDDDFLYRVVTPSVSDGAVGSRASAHQGEGHLQDFILLASKRKPCGSGDPYVIALRSVSLPTHPPTEEYNRGEVLCAGFTILKTKNNMSLISYYNQASPEVVPYISTDIAGLSSSFYHNFCSCRQYLTRNRLEATSSPEDQAGQNQASDTDSPTCDVRADNTQL
ncbi:acyl-coenzyme A thioesterase 11 isoform X3 [Cyclopterus lumpus]|nr:acyl-coenzyme A thioesterase 11 isoform X3 [Cyclopterus lumpus]